MRPSPSGVFRGVLCSLTAGLTIFVAGLSSADWPATLDHIAGGVVSIRVDHTRAFDENWNQSTQATGFVVDAERGLILTNRHVVGPGPSTAQAVFINQEEVDLEPVYRDPVHDFGFFRYNPADLKYMDAIELPLTPEAAAVGLDIRVVGNDAGEQLSILDGTLARLDRPAPAYGHGRYNDFNTFYYQAASSSSGGSSGSPVISVRGDVVALAAGSRTSAATSFFLPLTRVVRALAYIRNGERVPRGSLQTTFRYTPFADLAKLGLDEGTEARIRDEFTDTRGMLVVSQLVRGSPASESLEPGDILVQLEDRSVIDFDRLATLLDDNVGNEIRLQISRAGTLINVKLPVTNLDDISPRDFIEFDGAVLHDVSYQRARHYNQPLRGVYLADPGFTFAHASIPRGSIITEFNGIPVSNLTDFKTIVEDLHPGQQTAVRYRQLTTNQAERFANLRADLHWFPTKYCRGFEDSGFWQCLPIEHLDPAPPPGLHTQTATNFDAENHPPLVHVAFHAPYPLSGVPAGKRWGTGLIVDKERGYVLVSQADVPSSAGNVYLTFNGAVEIPGRVIHQHPTHSLSLVEYDRHLLNGYPVNEARLSSVIPAVGENYEIVGIDNEHKVRRQRSAIAEIEPVQFPVTSPPRRQNANTELLQFINGPNDYTGAIFDENGRVRGLWQKFEHRSNNRNRTWYRGVPLDVAVAFLAQVKNGKHWWDTGAGWFPTSLTEARKRGLPDDIFNERLASGASTFLELHRLTAGTSAARDLKPGDILISANGTAPQSLREIEVMSQTGNLDLAVLRDGSLEQVSLEPEKLPTFGLKRVAFWGGALIQPPPRVLAIERQLDLNGPYVSFYKYGSPASRAGLVANLRIVEINEQPVATVDELINVVRTLPDRSTARLKTLDLNNQVKVITLKIDTLYWPAYELVHTETGWIRRDIEVDHSSD